MEMGKLEQLDVFRVEDETNTRHTGIWVTRCRLGKDLNNIFGAAKLPVLMPSTTDTL